MCYAIPAKIIKIEGDTAVADYGGIKKKINISLLDVSLGDYVLVHAGFAIEKISQKSAEDILQKYLQLVDIIDKDNHLKSTITDNSSQYL